MEGAGATGLAAVLENQLPELVGKKYVLKLGKGKKINTFLDRWFQKQNFRSVGTFAA